MSVECGCGEKGRPGDVERVVCHAQVIGLIRSCILEHAPLCGLSASARREHDVRFWRPRIAEDGGEIGRRNEVLGEGLFGLRVRGLEWIGPETVSLRKARHLNL